MTRRFSLCTLVAAAALLASCETVPPIPPSPPTLEFVRSDCAAVPDLSSAISLTPDKERAVHFVSAPASSDTGCIVRDGQQTPYALFALPADFDDKTMTVGSTFEPLRILSPNVVILDGRGEVSRTFDAADYMYRGSVYSVQFRPRPNEAYVLVTADPSRVGRRYDSIAIGVVTTQVYTGYGTANVYSGTDVAQSRTFSYEGVVQVMVNDTDTEEKNATAAPVPAGP